ncbi:MAG TPA: SCP2 sterol-binding domain-containing protein [Burkholderiaceae bacterium]|nr:SCP2 sterol-binding domain-containing protein [Burkholderiaceae bacterium]
MNQSHFLLPKPVGKFLSLLPVYPGSLLFVTGLNLALRDKFPADVQLSLAGKKLCIKVTDAQLVFDFEWVRNGFSACRNAAAADLTISASAHDFLLLARRQEDPDTLFFSRRLSMEGDTELGLLVKNTLDAIELPVFELGKLIPSKILARIKSGPHS